MPNQYDDVKCSTQNCTNIAKRTIDNPLCRRCQKRIWMKLKRQKVKEDKEKEKQKLIEDEKKRNPISEEDMDDIIVNALLHQDEKRWKNILRRIDALAMSDLNNEQKKCTYGINQHEDPNMPTQFKFKNIPHAGCTFKLLLIMGEDTLSWKDKNIRRKQIQSELRNDLQKSQ